MSKLQIKCSVFSCSHISEVNKTKCIFPIRYLGCKQPSGSPWPFAAGKIKVPVVPVISSEMTLAKGQMLWLWGGLPFSNRLTLDPFSPLTSYLNGFPSSGSCHQPLFNAPLSCCPPQWIFYHCFHV